MRLESYITKRGISISAAARELGEGVQTVHRYCLPADHAESRIPRPPAMRKIAAWSEGAVTANDFYGITPIPPESDAQGGGDDPVAPAKAASMEAAE